MKTQITLGSKNNFEKMVLFFICLLSSFNSQGQKNQKILVETWKSEAWENLTQTFYTYDGSKYLIHDLSQQWDVSWNNFHKTDYTNNSDGTVNQSISQTWNTVSTGWDVATRSTFTYDGAKHALTEISDLWYDPNWMPFSKETNTYDGSGYLIIDLSQSWDFISSWKNSSQTLYTNNPDGTVSQELTQSWNGTTWNDTSRITYTYAGSKVIMSLEEVPKGLVWENSWMDTFDYDASGYLIYTLSKNWVSSAWKNDTQGFITNYADGNPHQIVYQSWDDTMGSWKNNLRITFDNGTLAVNQDVFKNSITIYPNPSHDNVTIATNNATPNLKYWVTDPVGKQVLKGSIDAKETVVDINPLATGVYFIQIMGQNNRQTFKMIKE